MRILSVRVGLASDHSTTSYRYTAPDKATAWDVFWSKPSLPRLWLWRSLASECLSLPPRSQGIARSPSEGRQPGATVRPCRPSSGSDDPSRASASYPPPLSGDRQIPVCSHLHCRLADLH